MENKVFSCVGEHVIYCCGARVLIKDGKVKVLSEPRITYCPLHEALYGTKEIDRESVKRSVEAKIRGLGFCCEQRVFDNSLVVPYGSSEIISTCMKMRLLECAVTVCEGAGTVITGNPDLVQEMGARLTGIVNTSPIKSIIKHIKGNGGFILDESSARIDQAEGVAKAAELGYRCIAVTVPCFHSDSIERIRGVEKKEDIEVSIFSVCNTCASEVDVDRILAGADVVCASASRLIRERIGPKAVMQLGVAIPLFVLTKLGKRLILVYLTEFKDSIVAFRTRKLPYIVEGKGPRLRD
ncbi:MAG: methanogenesis marker 8 protein [Candidatus Bathyarchaeia archaeon]